MKKTVPVLFLIAALLLLCACGGKTQNAPTSPDGGSAQLLRVVSGAGTASLVLAGQGGGEVYTAAAKELTVFIDGQKSEPGALRSGMLLALDPGCTVLESWPAQLTGATVRAQSDPGSQDHGDLCGLYLQVLEDLWTEDSGLNGDIAYISVDLSDAPGGLTEGEKAAVTWVFSGRHNAQGLGLGFEELKAQGYIKTDELYWEDGLLFSIKAAGARNSASKITFDARKWRSGDGALWFNGCTAARGSGLQWDPYKPGSFSVS